MSLTIGRSRLGGATASSGIAVRKNSGAIVGTRPQVNLIEGVNVTLTVADDAGTGEVDVTIASSGGGGLSDADYGDVTVSGGGTVMTIDTGAVTLAKMADIATDRIIGRDTAGAGVPEALTVGGGIEFSGAGGIQRSALVGGDVTAPAASAVATIANDAVTYAKMQDVTATDRLLGRSSVGAGDVEEIVCTAAGRAILADADAAAQRTTLGVVTPRRVVGVTFDGSGSPPTAGTVGYVVAPFSGTIDQWHIVGNASGSAVVDVWKAAGSIPTDANRIAGTEKPTLAAAQLGSDTSLTTWSTTAVAAGDVFGFELESAATLTRVTVEVRISESV